MPNIAFCDILALRLKSKYKFQWILILWSGKDKNKKSSRNYITTKCYSLNKPIILEPYYSLYLNSRYAIVFLWKNPRLTIHVMILYLPTLVYHMSCIWFDNTFCLSFLLTLLLLWLLLTLLMFRCLLPIRLVITIIVNFRLYFFCYRIFFFYLFFYRNIQNIIIIIK